MSGLVLFARSRRWPLCLAVIAIAGLTIAACGPLSYTLNPVGGYRVAAASQVPVIAALAIQGALASPVPRQEQQAARALWPARLLHIVALTAIAAAVAGVAALAIQPPDGVLLNAGSPLGPLALVRNVLAFTGASLLGAALVGPSLGWLVPLAWAILPAVALTGANADPTGLLKLATRPDSAPLPLATAAFIWVIGTVLATCNIRLRRASRTD